MEASSAPNDSLEVAIKFSDMFIPPPQRDQQSTRTLLAVHLVIALAGVALRALSAKASVLISTRSETYLSLIDCKLIEPNFRVGVSNSNTC